jgi:hypothetical protein
MDAPESIIDFFVTFRNRLYEIIPKRRDATLELIDALSSNTQADSVVKLSLNEHFRRTYNSVRDAVSNFFPVMHRIKKRYKPIRKNSRRWKT